MLLPQAKTSPCRRNNLPTLKQILSQKCYTTQYNLMFIYFARYVKIFAIFQGR